MNYGHDINYDEADAPAESIPGAPRGRRSSASITSTRLAVSRTAALEPQPATRTAAAAPFDGWALVDSILPRWYWLVIAAVVTAALGAWAAMNFWYTSYSVSAQLIRYEPPVGSDTFKPQAISTPTLVSMIKSPELMQRVGAQMQPARSGDEIAGMLRIVPERDSDVTTVTASGGDIATVVNAVNIYSREVIRYTQDAQKKEANEANEYVAVQLAANEADLAKVRQTMQALVLSRPAGSAGTSMTASATAERLQAAREKLAELLASYTDEHPLVREQRARISALTDMMSASSAQRSAANAGIVALPASARLGAAGGVVAGATVAPGLDLALEDEDFLHTHFRTLDASHTALVARQRAVQTFLSNPPGYFRILVPAAESDARASRNHLKIAALTGFGAVLGIMAMSVGLICFELLDDRLKTGADVKRVTRLPLLAALGDVRRLSPAAQDNWAFRTWTALQRRLSVSPNHGVVCGITSANYGDGRTTWINLLARAANQRGFRVLTIATSAGPTGRNTKVEPVVKVETPKSAAPATGNGNGNGHGTKAEKKAAKAAAAASVAAATSDSTPLTANVLTSPKEVADKLTGPNAQPVVHIPLPGWVWNLERRKQWQAALAQWRKIDNVVILVELPPASVAESVLLAENLPNLIWLVKAGRSDAAETRIQLETLRHGRCNLVGAVLNHESGPPVRRRFTRWIGAIAFLIASTGLTDPSAFAQTSDASFSVVKPQRAAWQQRLTLGSGDVVSLSLFGQPELTRVDVPIGPDGRISYLEAQNVQATGLTVDELRAALNEELSKFRRAPQAIVVPVVYRSKKFVALGAVVQKGIFPLERPMTIIEAVAMARGLETGLSDRNVVELADFSQSFLARQGQKVPVDFEKLFLEGDLTQNIAIEPGDYLYFPPANRLDVYVLGEVKAPGIAPQSSAPTAVAAVTARGGFSDRAWKNRILVIRGSLNNPETFVVDAAAVLSARAPDLRLKPKDIVYVSARPWIKVEELLDLAATAFVESAVVTWTGLHVTPLRTPERPE